MDGPTDGPTDRRTIKLRAWLSLGGIWGGTFILGRYLHFGAIPLFMGETFIYGRCYYFWALLHCIDNEDIYDDNNNNVDDVKNDQDNDDDIGENKEENNDGNCAENDK